MKYNTHRRASGACGGNGPYSTYSETIHSFLLRFFLIFLSFALFFSPLFSPPLLFHMSILSIYQKAPDDNLIRVQRDTGLCVWHQPVGSPGKGRTRRALDVQDSRRYDKREKAVHVLRVEKEIPLRQLLFCSSQELSFRTAN